MAGNETIYRRVVRLREKKKLTFEEIGKEVGFSRQRAWEIYNRAVKQFTIPSPAISSSSARPESSRI